MRPIAALLACASAGCAHLPQMPASGMPPALAAAGQLVLVVTPSWTATSGELRRYERSQGGWTPVGAPAAVVVGKGGLGWGRGLHGEPPGEPAKREGDGRAPAGLFAVGPAFGVEDAPPGTKLPYVKTGASLECVDDVKSPRYNQLVDTVEVKKDWTSWEEMRRKDALYDLGLFVSHNAPQAVAQGGSCIFVHVWKAPGAPTVGCTALPKDGVAEILSWLDPAKAPVLVQLPKQELARLRSAWKLP